MSTCFFLTNNVQLPLKNRYFAITSLIGLDAFMTFPKILALVACILFGVIGIAALFKGGKKAPVKTEDVVQAPLEIQIDHEIKTASTQSSSKQKSKKSLPVIAAAPPVPVIQRHQDRELPEADRIEELFSKTDPKLPIVQTVVYKSRVPWQKGRPAWLSDYAAHYSTSRHFIARSLNGKADYFKQDIAEGDRFNVLNPDKNINFYMLIDTSRSKMWFYYIDMDTQERVLLKTYPVGLGRLDSSKPSGMLTPLGKYTLGNKIAIYKPKVMGMYQGKKSEMIQIFGTRWIPFDKEIGEATPPAASLGLHGIAWIPNSKGELVENIECLGKYESDGCIRLSTADMEEIFAIVITRPTTVELVKDFFDKP